MLACYYFGDIASYYDSQWHYSHSTLVILQVSNSFRNGYSELGPHSHALTFQVFRCEDVHIFLHSVILMRILEQDCTLKTRYCLESENEVSREAMCKTITYWHEDTAVTSILNEWVTTWLKVICCCSPCQADVSLRGHSTRCCGSSHHCGVLHAGNVSCIAAFTACRVACSYIA